MDHLFVSALIGGSTAPLILMATARLHFVAVVECLEGELKRRVQKAVAIGLIGSLFLVLWMVGKISKDLRNVSMG